MNLQYVEEEENLDVKEEDDDEHIERVSFVNMDSPSIYDEYFNKDEYML